MYLTRLRITKYLHSSDGRVMVEGAAPPPLKSSRVRPQNAASLEYYILLQSTFRLGYEYSICWFKSIENRRMC